MKVLVACEFSGVVRDAFLALGHDAMSCDLLPSDLPGPHHHGDVLDILGDGWDLMIAHPPCTYLTGAAEWAYADRPMINGQPRNLKEGTLIGTARRDAREKALIFVSNLWCAPIQRKCIENPVGIITRELPEMGRPQYIQPYMFGHDASKKTGLWLDNLPTLQGTEMIKPRYVDGKPRWGNQTDSGQNKESPADYRWKKRSITYHGIAEAMAEQWGLCNF